MNPNNSLTTILRTNCMVIESCANADIVKTLFDFTPCRYIPVVKGLQFIGVIMRNEFYQKFAASGKWPLNAGNLISKEIIRLSTTNTIAEARDVFDTRVFDLIVVTDEYNELSGIVVREDVEAVFYPKSRKRGILAGVGRALSLHSYLGKLQIEENYP